MGRLIRLELTNAWFTARCVNPFTTAAKCLIIIKLIEYKVKGKRKNHYIVASSYCLLTQQGRLDKRDMLHRHRLC